MKRIIYAIACLFIAGCNNNEESTTQANPVRPNIFFIVADDLGFADLGCFGGDISTPNIDELASNGLLFNRFHTSPICAPTRSMILTGNDNHVAGMGSMFSVSGTSREGKPGYEHQLSDRIVTVAQLLKDGGYQTYMAGKWHIGRDRDRIPYAQGFEKSFTLLDGAANHYGNTGFDSDGPPTYYEDTTHVKLPDSKYSTDVYTEKIMNYIENGQKDKPFFAYLPYTTPHWPLQVPEDWLDKYKGKYDMGYDSLRILRFEQQKKKGIIPDDAQLPLRDSRIIPWDQLSDDEKKSESRKMELYAAMVENLDYHIGQLIRFLKDKKLFDNTLFVFMADNGAAAEDFYYEPEFSEYVQSVYNNNYENMGKPSSFVSYGPQWAQAGAAPFKLFKEYPTEGGTNTPLIISGKGVERTPGLQNIFINLMDLAPTFLEIAGLTYPDTYQNRKLKPMMGESALSFLKGENNTVHDENYVFGMEHYGGCMLLKGKWKITNISDPFDESAFGLYDMELDWGESNDLSQVNPEKFSEMMNEWELFKKKTGTIVPDKGEKIKLNVYWGNFERAN